MLREEIRSAERIGGHTPIGVYSKFTGADNGFVLSKDGDNSLDDQFLNGIRDEGLDCSKVEEDFLHQNRLEKEEDANSDMPLVQAKSAKVSKGSLPNSAGRKIYETYYTRDKIEDGLLNDSLKIGRIHVSRYNFCYCIVESEVDDYVIVGKMANRCFDGDNVVIKVVEDKRRETKEKQEYILEHVEDMYEDVDENDCEVDSDKLGNADEVRANKRHLLMDQDEALLPGNIRFNALLYKYVDTPVRFAEVVAVIRRRDNIRYISGYFEADDWDKMNRGLKLVPISEKDPRVFVPRHVIASHGNYVTNNPGMMYVVSIGKWPENRVHPFAKSIHPLGNRGDLKAETDAILLSYSIIDEPYDFDLDMKAFHMKYLDNFYQEMSNRVDLRSAVRCFTIDPYESTDMDDALSIQGLPNGNFSVGVHISDVSYFIDAGTCLDKYAADRGTSIYLTGKTLSMLPQELVSRYLSLVPFQDRYTISIIWELTSNGQIVNTRLFRSIIRSCAKLSYDEVQRVFEIYGLVKPASVDTPAYCRGDTLAEDTLLNRLLCKDLFHLFHITQSLRARRQQRGSYTVDRSKLQVYTDPETGLPDRIEVEKQNESHQLVEEMMLLANSCVGEYLATINPEIALLRRCLFRINRKLRETNHLFRALRIPIDVFKAREFGKLLSDIPDWMSLPVQEILVKNFDAAEYFPLASHPRDHFHFHLNVPYYTHFTSPIRRYFDIMVHRQLVYAMNGCEDLSTLQRLESLSAHLNRMKRKSKRIERDQRFLYLVHYLSRHPVSDGAYVLRINSSSVRLFSKELCLSRSFYWKDILDERLKAVWNAYSRTIDIREKGKKSVTIQRLTYLSVVPVLYSASVSKKCYLELTARVLIEPESANGN